MRWYSFFPPLWVWRVMGSSVTGDTKVVQTIAAHSKVLSTLA